ncbi:MAG: alpha/beta hydrolase [Chloroflexota bacterium]|nr:alpha/beta hydrolase [Chloroflexota bacterium]
MTAPEVRYCTTSDGVSIAYYVMGDGPSIVRASTTFGSHLLLERSMSGIRPSMEALERRHRVVRYDGRGSGLSQRESSDFSLAARLLDLESVVDHLGLESFALDGPYHSGLAAVAYAVRHPERITHLILSDAFARGRDRYEASPATRARAAMPDHQRRMGVLRPGRSKRGLSILGRGQDKRARSPDPSLGRACYDARVPGRDP